jgi:hypothetical protein
MVWTNTWGPVSLTEVGPRRAFVSLKLAPCCRTRTGCRPRAVACSKQRGGPTVRQSCPPGSRVEVAGWELHAGASVCEEHRAGPAPLEQAGQEPSTRGLPDDHVDSVTLAANLGAAVDQVQLADVEGEDLTGAGGSFVEEPPQGPLSNADILTAKQRLDLVTGQSLDAVGCAAAAAQAAGRVRGRVSQPWSCQ